MITEKQVIQRVRKNFEGILTSEMESVSKYITECLDSGCDSAKLLYDFSRKILARKVYAKLYEDGFSVHYGTEKEGEDISIDIILFIEKDLEDQTVCKEEVEGE
jgi:hypothetical protein